MPDPVTPRVADLPFRSHDKVRYSDTDRQGHVNNAIFATFLETGRVELLFHPERPIVDAGAECVIAKLALEYRGEIHWPGDVQVGTGVVRIGTSSMTLLQVAEQEGRTVATAETVIVQIDTATRKARPLSAVARERLLALRVEANA
ncbi:MAG: acyl-CoA thioesterase [Gemmatimonadaceae bacterium]|nr:acyl-CoA thioesterase [Gemmatimonadaceae bacterium]